VFNQDNKPKLRIIPVTAATSKALNLPDDFARNTEGEDADNATIRAVYVIDDSMPGPEREKLRTSIIKGIRKSDVANYIKEALKSDPDDVIRTLYEQAISTAGATESEVIKALGADLTDDIIFYKAGGLFYVDATGEKLGKVGDPVDPNDLIFSTLPTTDLTFRTGPSAVESRYTNKDKLNESEVKDWWRERRADMLCRGYMTSVSVEVYHILSIIPQQTIL